MPRMVLDRPTRHPECLSDPVEGLPRPHPLQQLPLTSRQVHAPVRGRPRSLISLERSEEHTSELQSRQYLVCRLLLEKKKNKQTHAPPSKKQKNTKKKT